MSLMSSVTRLAVNVAHPIDLIGSLFNLAVRLYVANVFFRAGLVKIQSWSTTLTLFENEYAVPVLPPELAAYLGTAGELVLPFLLVLGLGGRFAALGLFILNVIAVISYPDLSEGGLKDHILWGWLLAFVFFSGAGRLSLDFWLQRRHLRDTAS